MNPELKKNACDTLNKVFLAHPREVGESYGQHFWYTIKVAFYLFLTGFAAITHGLFPSILQTTTSDRVIALADDMKARRAGRDTAKAANAAQ